MSIPKTKKDNLLNMVSKAIAGIREEVRKANQGKQALDGIQQLKFIETKLCEMEAVLKREDWKTVPKGKPGIARLVIDTWPINDPLGKLISQIEYEYGRLK